MLQSNYWSKRVNMEVILKFKRATEDTLEKKKMEPTQVLFFGYSERKNVGFTNVANFALDYITPCTANKIFLSDGNLSRAMITKCLRETKRTQAQRIKMTKKFRRNEEFRKRIREPLEQSAKLKRIHFPCPSVI